ncbi:hypothetical protein [Georgenia sp. SUBG003]|uniref:hypothetical protein n=1 Tax=Georgenia sp. SUBG003 TaxID=1497974 RepID=UPI0004D97AED|nr:hypothetical protein DA06_25635 [Georgenia sp. SUBG003]
MCSPASRPWSSSPRSSAASASRLPALLLTFFWLRFLGREGWRTSVLVSVGVVAAFYAIFVGALGVPIPHLF